MSSKPSPDPRKILSALLPSERFGTAVAILIAVISIVGVLTACGAARASSMAAEADSHGLLANVDKENAKTEAYTTLYGHLTTYARSIRNDTLARVLEKLASDSKDEKLQAQLRDQADALTAAAERDRLSIFIPGRYLGRDQVLDQERDLGETIADQARHKDILPEPHFLDGDFYRLQAQLLLGCLILLGVAFVLLTLAEAIRNRARYLLLLGGVSIFLFATFAALVVSIILPQPFIRQFFS